MDLKLKHKTQVGLTKSLILLRSHVNVPGDKLQQIPDYVIPSYNTDCNNWLGRLTDECGDIRGFDDDRLVENYVIESAVADSDPPHILFVRPDSGFYVNHSSVEIPMSVNIGIYEYRYAGWIRGTNAHFIVQAFRAPTGDVYRYNNLIDDGAVVLLPAGSPYVPDLTSDWQEPVRTSSDSGHASSAARNKDVGIVRSSQIAYLIYFSCDSFMLPV